MTDFEHLFELGVRHREVLDQRDALLRLLIQLGHKTEAEEALDQLDNTDE